MFDVLCTDFHLVPSIPSPRLFAPVGWDPAVETVGDTIGAALWVLDVIEEGGSVDEVC